MNKWIRCAVAALVMALLFSHAGLLAPVRAEGDSQETQEEHTEETQAECTEETTEPTVPVARDENGLTCRQAVVYDTVCGQTLFSKEVASGKVYPASITKLFSAFVALQYLSPEETVTAGKELELVAADSSRAFILEGQTLTVSMLVEGLLLPSGNDAAYVLATAAGRQIAEDPDLECHQAVQVFVDEMNAVARDLGLKDSHFMNPDGYHMGGHYSSLSDLVRIARLVLENPVICGYVGKVKDDVVYVSGETNSWKNTNEILNPESEFYREDACGLKTGFTDPAGSCLMSAFRTEEGYVIIGVFGCPGHELRFEDTVHLAEQYI